MSAPTEFEPLLKDLVTAKRLSASKVQKLTELALASMQHDTQLVSILYRTHKTLPAVNKVNSLYAFDALARAARSQVNKKNITGDLNSPVGNCATFLLKVEGVLDGLMQDLVGTHTPEVLEKAKKVLDIWTKSATFPPPVLARLSDITKEKKDPRTVTPAPVTLSQPPLNHVISPPPLQTHTPTPPPPAPALPGGASLSSVLALLGGQAAAMIAPATDGPSTSSLYGVQPLSTAVPPPASLGSALALIQQLAGKNLSGGSVSQTPAPISMVASGPTYGHPPQHPGPIGTPIQTYVSQERQDPAFKPPFQQQNGHHLANGGVTMRGGGLPNAFPRPPFPNQQFPAPPQQFQQHNHMNQQQFSNQGNLNSYGNRPSSPNGGNRSPPGRGRWNGSGGSFRDQEGRGGWRGRGFDRGRGQGGWRGRGGGPADSDRRSSWSRSRSRSRERDHDRDRSRSPQSGSRRPFDRDVRRDVRPYSPPRRPTNPTTGDAARGRDERRPQSGKDEFGRDIVERSGSVSPPRNGSSRQPSEGGHDAPIRSRDGDDDVPEVDMEMGTPEPEQRPEGAKDISSLGAPAVAAETNASASSAQGATSVAQGGLQQFDFSTFNASNPESWQSLAAAWAVTNGSPPSQEQLLQLLSMMMNGGETQQDKPQQQQQQINDHEDDHGYGGRQGGQRGNWRGGNRGGYRGGGFRGRGRGGGGGGGGSYGYGGSSASDAYSGTDAVVLGGGD